MQMQILKTDLEYILSKLTDVEITKFQNSTILITGCAGFLGFMFMHFLKTYSKFLGIKNIIAVDNFMLGIPQWIEPFRNDAHFELQKFDIIHDKIENLKNVDRADLIIHMASIASPTFYRQYPIETLDANIWGLRSLLDFYCQKPVKGFLFFSSSELYGNPDPQHVPTSEEYFGYVNATGPRSCYDESKRFGETMCMLFAQKYGMPIGVARPFNNYGPGMRLNDKRVVADFALAIKENRNLEILSNGSPTRTFCYVADAIVGYLKILLHGEYDYFNIGIEQPELTISELAEIYVDEGKTVFGYRGEVIYTSPDDSQYLTDNPQRRCPSIEKARKKLGYNPTIYVKEGICRFLHFIKESEEGSLKW